MYPRECNYRRIIARYKHGKRSKSNNYRYITLKNSLGNTFIITRQKSIENYQEKEKLLPRKRYRTIDQIKILFSIVKKIISKEKYLYICFVDFSKTYVQHSKSLQIAFTKLSSTFSVYTTVECRHMFGGRIDVKR